MAYEQIIYSKKDKQAWITLNRPEKRNAMSTQLLRETNEAFDDAEADANVVCIVLTGAGDKAFCAGADLGGGPGGDGMIQQHEGRGQLAQLIMKMGRLGKPILCAANGSVLAGGMGLMMACDIVISKDTNEFSLPEIKRGLFPMMVMGLLIRNIGRKKAMEMLLTGEKISAAEAERIGLINHAVPAAQYDAKVAEMAAKLASFSPAINKLGKQAFNAMQDMSLPEALPFLQAMLGLNVMTEDAIEGVMAFIQKREPVWKGR